MAKQMKKTTVKKIAVKPAPVMEHNCGSDCPCGCHKHGTGHRVKHVIILLLVFILGYACGKIMCCGKHRMPPMPRMPQPVFTNGCMDMQFVQNPKVKEMLMSADVNGDNCISMEEYKAQKAKWAEKHAKKNKHGMFFGMKHGFHSAKSEQPKPQQD